VNLDDAITEIARARKRLADDQGRLARKNARAAVKAAVATALRAMDREYPLLRKERVVRAAMTPLAKKRRERQRRMAVSAVTSAMAAELAALGVRVEPASANDGKLWYVPVWAARALTAKIGATEIRRAIRSRSVRNRIEALLRLRDAA
jgi:hypothetical protein